MVITITIETDNAAFSGGDEFDPEVRRILANWLRELPVRGMERRLMDVNGNTVGQVEVLQ